MVDWTVPGGLAAGLLIATVTAPVLLPLGFWLCLRALAPASHHLPPAGELAPRTLTGFALAVGVVGGIYAHRRRLPARPHPRRTGSARCPRRPGRARRHLRHPLVGAAAYTLLALASTGDVAPDW
ncbi:putative protein OS=Streptomyces aurantiogriseus OX=66870 GN=GCM10010251_95470 PE=4 SV=1 [Streptomyces aurantiogriseus]|uniref:Uncharacterized protein n=1 Tax=Streptomyces aurantiogriseus TaxID=66870 RepID=A0A918L0A9_9ACTN|nr:hypothetical protein GCM10010251_95470 [Streptomyces aurantiogriseus]